MCCLSDYDDFFEKGKVYSCRQAHNKHIANNQAQTNFYYKQVRRIHPNDVTDTTRTHYTTQYDKS
jgi:hypothetical protein